VRNPTYEAIPRALIRNLHCDVTALAPRHFFDIITGLFTRNASLFDDKGKLSFRE
jgi:hypothetical protein